MLASNVVSTTAVTCNGGSNGAIDFNVVGGTTPYAYIWSNGSTNQDHNSIMAGLYTVTVQDANGCTLVDSATVSEPSAVAITITKTDVTCNGQGNGAASAATAGGLPPYSYAWSTGATTASISGLNIGNYSVTVTDATGCIGTESVTISEASAFTTGTSLTHVSCNGFSDGAIDLTVSGGTQPYSYTWSTGASIQDLSGLAVGTYSVSISDANACPTSLSITITEPDALGSSMSVTSVSSCHTGDNGEADLTVTGGTPPYSYAWSSGANTQDLTGLTPGTYVVTVTDANGCSLTEMAVVVQDAAMVVTLSGSDVSCNGGADGTANTTVTGGTPPYQYSWIHGPTSANLTGLTPGTYFVLVIDARGCPMSASVLISEPPAIQATLTPTNISCNGANDGSIDLSVNGGTGPYTYSWSTGSNAEDISALSPGNYGVTVTDANGCSVAEVTTVIEPAVLSGAAVASDISCNGQTNGSIDLSVSGGTSPYSYNWSTGSNSQDISGLGAGTYSVTITDARGCTANTSATIANPSALSANAVGTDPSCSNGGNGMVDLTVSGGNPPYTFSWSNGGSTEDISGLGQGTYSVLIADANGCTGTASATLTEPTALNISVSSTDVTCNGNTDGTVGVSVSGGTGAYSYAWSNGSTDQNQSGLAAGNYGVTVTDGNGCTITGNAGIIEPTALTASITGTDVSCNGGNDGGADLTVSGGTTPYSYIWSNGSNSEDLTGIGAGTYTVTVSDANGCTWTGSVSLTEPPALTASTSATDASCFGASDGAVDLTTGGGTPPYFYSWSNTTFTEDQTNVVAGTYSVTVTDAAGCSITTSGTVGEPAEIVSTASITDVQCAGNSTGAVDLTVSGGAGGFTYAWSNGANTQDISGVSDGSYDVTITDGSGCSIVQTHLVGVVSSLTTTSAVTDADCNGNATGAIDLTVSGGTGPYTFSWAHGPVTEDLSGLSAGTYMVTVSENGGCTNQLSITVNEPAAIIATGVATDVDCNGASTGGIDLSVSGGTSPYSYAWTTGGTDEDMSNLAAGIYVVTVTDQNGCTGTASVNVGEPAALSINASSTDITCNGANDGSIDITATGGISPYTFIWGDGTTDEDRTGLAAGTYSVTATDVNGCTISASATITEPSAFVVTYSSVNVSCAGESDGTIDVTASGGTGPYSYSWSDGNISEDRSGLSAGTYAVTVTDANGCSDNNSFTITEPSAMSLSATTNSVLCNGDSTGAVDLTATGGAFGYSYLWSNGETTEDLSNVVGGQHTVTVTDANGCTATYTATINQPSSGIVLFTFPTSATCGNSGDGSINLVRGGGTLPYSYLWSTGSASEDLTNVNPGVYCVTVTDGNGCTATTCETVGGPTPVSVGSILVVDASCAPANDGAITGSFSGGTPPFTYNWSNGATTANISGLATGVYSVTLTEGNGCTLTTTFTIAQAAALMLTSTTVDPSTPTGTDGSIDLTVHNGSAPYTYAWSNGANTQDLTGIGAGIYSVTVTDATGCQGTLSDTLTAPSSGGCDSVTTVWTTNVGYQSATLNWSAVSGAHHYRIEGSIVGNSFLIVITVPGNATNKNVFGLNAANEYRWHIRAFCDSAETLSGPYSVWDTFNPTCPVPDSCWTSNIGPTYVQFNWNAAQYAKGYEIQARIVGGPWIPVLVGQNSTSWSTSILNPTSTYQWRVRTYCETDGSQKSDWSQIHSFTTLPTCPGPDSNWTSVVQTNAALLEWNAAPVSVSAYEILGRKVGNANWVSLMVPGNATSKPVFGLLPNTTYEWAVRAWCNASGSNKSAYTAVVQFTTLNFENRTKSGGLETHDLRLRDFSAYPNPNEGRFNLTFTTGKFSETVRMQIFDLTGRTVVNELIEAHDGINVREVDLSTFGKGIFNVQISGDNESLFTRIIVE